MDAKGMSALHDDVDLMQERLKRRLAALAGTVAG